MLDTNAQVPQDFDLRGYLGNTWSVYRGERSYHVEVLFTKEAAATATEGIWHHTQKTRKNKDGSVILTFQVDGLNEIVRWILGWGNRAKVIWPPELRDMIVAQLKQTIQTYDA